jgi:hypothetical protein
MNYAGTTGKSTSPLSQKALKREAKCGPIAIEGLDPDLIELYRSPTDTVPCPYCKTELATKTAYVPERTDGGVS